jgi:hypothetical protein
VQLTSKMAIAYKSFFRAGEVEEAEEVKGIRKTI